MRENTKCPKCGSNNAFIDDDTGAFGTLLIKCLYCGYENQIIEA